MNDLSFRTVTSVIVILFFEFAGFSVAEFESTRCRCLCPNPTVVAGTHSDRRIFIANVPPDQCKCDDVVMPQVYHLVNQSKLGEFCVRCSCKYQSRNVDIIKVVVVCVLIIIVVLVVYMGFLMCLDPLLKRRAGQFRYQQHRESEEENIFAASRPEQMETVSAGERPSNVLQRVQETQNKWLRKVEDQRDDVFKKHSMLS